MDLFIVRHAHAGPGTPDDARTLSAAGRSAFTALARGLDLPTRIDKIAASPLVRAQQTAAILCDARGWPAADSWNDLQPEGDVETVLRRVRATKARCLVLVAHQPLVSRLAQALTGQEIAFSPGTIARLDFDGQARAALRWSASP